MPPSVASAQAGHTRHAGAATPRLRIRPVPRSEPLADGERLGPVQVVDRVLPPDLATGVRVRRSARERRGGLAGPPVWGAAGDGLVAVGVAGRTPPRPTDGSSAAGTAATGAQGPVRGPEGVVAVVTARLHAPVAAIEHEEPPVTGSGYVVAPGLAQGGGEGPSSAAAPPTGSHELRKAARLLLAACVEVIGGFRPVGQLRPYCAPERFDAIATRLLRPVDSGRGHGATRSSVVARTTAVPTPGRPGRTPPHDQVAVRRVQVCYVTDGVAELAVVMSRRGKVWAMAMRMERRRDRWQCMHMEVL